MKKFKKRKIVLFQLISLLLFVANSTMSAEKIDPEADNILKSMSDYLGNLSG